MAKNENRIQPIVEQMEPSLEQIGPILARNQDIVVTAGAGTGKTRTLVARYLSLLAEGTPLRAIVAITFTKKAAREMRNRIREKVRTYLQKSDLSKEEMVYWREIYESLDAARISTIHSLAADILKQHPAEMGLDPKFELLDEGQAARLKAQAVEAAMAWGSEDPVASAIYPVYGAWKLRRTIAALFSNRLDIDAAFDKVSEDIWKDWEPLLTQPIRSFVDEPGVISALDEFLSYESEGILLQAERYEDLLVEDLRIVIDHWKKIKKAKENGDWLEVSRWLGPLRSHLKQKGKKDNWAPGNPRPLIKTLQSFYDENIGLEQLDLAIDQKMAQKIIGVLRSLFNFAGHWYDAAKEQVNGLDFDDLEEKSLSLLTNYPYVKDYWQKKIKALLVDEYQDTNDRQRELVNNLNGGGNRLFIVGDGKQSIYRFRGADVAVFRQEQERIGESGSSFELPTSYRAHPDLLGNLNTILEPVLGTDKSISYIEPFAALSPGRNDEPRYKGHPYVELHLAAGTKADGAGRIAAEAVASRIVDILDDPRNLASERPLTFGDVAVLCRASGSFTDFESAFEKAGIPYLTVAGQGFFDRPEIRDLLNTLAAFSDTQNDLAMAGLMRSPVIGFPDDLLLFFRDIQKKGAGQSLFEVVIQHTGLLEKELKDRALYFIEVVERFSTLVGRISAADLLSRYLEESGYVAAMAMGGNHRNIQNMKKLITDAQNSGIVSVSEFLDTVSELKNIAVREGEAVSVAEGAVQIMTVHQAKGLEFPVVVLGDASKKDRFSRDILVHPEFGLVLPMTETRILEMNSDQPALQTASSLAYEIALKEERLREEAESDRLFYVAATRAEELLIISGVLGKLNKDRSLGKIGGWLDKAGQTIGLGELDLDFGINGDSVYNYQIDRRGVEAQLWIYEPEVDLDLSNRVKPEKIAPAVGELQIPELDKDQPLLAASKTIKYEIYRAASVLSRTTAPARIIGDVVHRALQLWKFPVQGESEFIDWVVAELKNRGVFQESEVKDGYRRVKSMLERFQDHQLFSSMTNAEKLLHEVPYSMGNSGEGAHSGVIDALYRENGSWFIVEFKTDEIRNKKRFDWIWQNEDYQQQVAKYIDAVKNILGEEPEAVLCFLNYENRIHLVTDRW